MEGITITRPVIIKVRVTDKYKKTVAAEIQEAITRLDMQIQHLDFQARRLGAELEKHNPQGIAAAKHMEQERQRKLEARRKMVEKLKETGKMAVGAEVVYGQVESLVDLRLGDDWLNLMSVEVLIEDGRVIEIRQGGTRGAAND